AEAAVPGGAQKGAIEVPRGAPLGGYGGRRRAESEGRVYARALVLRSGEVRAVIVGLDALLVSSDLEEEVLRRTQLPPRTCLLLAATHTHSGPGGTWDNALAELAGNGRFDRGMRDAVAQAVADAIRGALGYLRTGRFAIAQVEWGDGPAVVRSAGPVDPTLLALQARDGRMDRRRSARLRGHPALVAAGAGQRPHSLAAAAGGEQLPRSLGGAFRGEDAADDRSPAARRRPRRAGRQPGSSGGARALHRSRRRLRRLRGGSPPGGARRRRIVAHVSRTGPLPVTRPAGGALIEISE